MIKQYDFEARYVDVKWQDRETLDSFESAITSIPIESSLEDGLFIETEAFRNYKPRIGFRIFSDQLLHTPFFIAENDTIEELMPIKDMATGYTWWIQSGKWNNKEKRYETELFRSVGRAYLKIQKQNICLINDKTNFDINDLEFILKDFKDGLLETILNPSSVSKGNVNKNSSTAYNQQCIDLLKDFTGAVENICNNPAIQLIEVQKKQNSRINRPVPRTFMEVASKGVTKQLTSRTFEENLDTAENRYVHYCLTKLLKLYSHANNAAINFKTKHDENLQNEEHEEKRLNELIRNKKKTVNAEVFDNETKNFEAELLDLQSMMDASVSNVDDDSIRLFTYKIQLIARNDDLENHFLCKCINGIDVTQKYKKPTYFVFPEQFSRIKLQNVSAEIEIQITGNVIKSGDPENILDEYLKIEYLSIHNVCLIKHPLFVELNERCNYREFLVKNDWVVAMNRVEIEELQSEKIYLETKIKKLRSESKLLDLFCGGIGPILKRLKTLKTFFVSNKIKVNSTFPNNMIFVKNPYYYAARSTFTKFSNVDGFDDSIFSLLTSVQRLGIINISIIYERWCLLKIIQILVEIYRFEMQTHWRKHLLESVLSNCYNIEFSLKAQHSERELILTYEKQLPNGKRPDFVIDLLPKRTEHSNDSNPPKRLVLDAKFKDYLKGKKLTELVHNLYVKKDYSEGDVNQVFILHPTLNSIEKMSSPLEWGKSCDYGQLVDHKFGGVSLSPTKNNHDSILNVQRLLGMFLQESIYLTKEKQDGVEIIKHNLFCIACGNDNAKDLVLINLKYSGKNSSYFVKCNICKFSSNKNYCFSCKRDLFKNGSKWTYHKTKALQITNVVCPECQSMF